MSFSFTLADEATVRAFWEWRYEPPYDVYDLDTGSADLTEQVSYLLDPTVNCHGVWDASGELVAYCTFGQDAQVPGGDYAADALDIGLGVRPDLNGQGRGLTYVSAVIDFARRGFAPPALRVTIAAFNRRAQRVWEKAGFWQVASFERDPDGMRFVVLVGEG